MDANYFREKAETCRRLANDLPWNNPDRFHFMDLAEDFQKRAELAQSTDAGRSREEALGRLSNACRLRTTPGRLASTCRTRNSVAVSLTRWFFQVQVWRSRSMRQRT